MSDPFIPGIRRISVRAKSRRSGVTHQFYFVLNLEQLTEEVAFGLPGHDKDSGTPREFWSDMELSQCVLGEHDATFVAKLAAENLALEFSETILNSDLNDKAVTFARGEGGFNSRMFDADGNDLGSTTLFIPEWKVRGKALGRSFRELAAERTYEVAFGSDDVISSRLVELMTYYLKPLQKLNRQVRAQSQVVSRAIGKVQNAHLAMTAMQDFARTPAERRKLWATNPPKVKDLALVDDASIIPNAPTNQQRSDAASLRDNTLPNLISPLTDLLAWLNDGSSGESKAPLARERNKAAKTLLDTLRTEDVVTTLLAHSEFVAPGIWFVFELFLVECFSQMATAPDVLAELLGAEFMTIASLATARDLVLDVPEESTRRERELVAAINTFVPDTELVAKKTTLTEALENLGKADGAKSTLGLVQRHGDAVSRLVFAAVPSVSRKLAELANAMNRDGDLAARSWLFRTAVGVADVNDGMAQRLFNDVSKLAKTSDKANAKVIFDLKHGALRDSRLALGSDIAWSSVKGILATQALWEVFVANRNKGDLAVRQLKAISTVITAAETGLELTQALAKAPSYFLASERGKGLVSGISTVTDHALFKGVGHFGSFIGFVGTILVESQKRPTSVTETEQSRENVLLSGVQLALAIGAAVIPGGLPVASLVLFVGQTFLLNRDVWAAVIPGIEALPGPGQFVRAVWKDLHTDKALKRVSEGSPVTKRLRDRLILLDQRTPEALSAGRGAFWRISPGDFILAPRAAGVLQQQYGFDQASATLIVRR